MSEKELKSYDAAMTELDEILSYMEGDHVAIDDLEKKVERAAELLKFCNDKLRNTELKVKKIIEDLEIK